MAVKGAHIKEFQDEEDKGGISFTLKFFEKSCFRHPGSPKKANFLAMNVCLKWLMTGEALKKYNYLRGYAWEGQSTWGTDFSHMLFFWSNMVENS